MVFEVPSVTDVILAPLSPKSCQLAEKLVSPHAVLLLDRAGWHTTGALVWPRNITPILLPSRSPELNPVEQVWQFLRANFLSNSVFETYDDIIKASSEAWNCLVELPQTITSIGTRAWAHVGQS